MSALPPKADILRVVEKRLLMTLSGHSLDYAIQQVCTEHRGFLTAVMYCVSPAYCAVAMLENSYPAQHDSIATSLSNVCAASLTPSDRVR